MHTYPKNIQCEEASQNSGALKNGAPFRDAPYRASNTVPIRIIVPFY